MAVDEITRIYQDETNYYKECLTKAEQTLVEQGVELAKLKHLHKTTIHPDVRRKLEEVVYTEMARRVGATEWLIDKSDLTSLFDSFTEGK